MAYTNAHLCLDLGNVVSHIRGPAPGDALDRALNPVGRGRRDPLGRAQSDFSGRGRSHLSIGWGRDDLDGGGYGDLSPSEAPEWGLGGAAAGGWETADRPRSLIYDPRRQTFLTGALATVEAFLRRQGSLYRVEDRRTNPPRRYDWTLENVTLRDYQESVVRLALKRGHGTIDLGTSGGKTILAAAIIARIGLPTIYLVTTRTLLHQTVGSLREFFGFEPGVIGDGIRRPGPITVAIAQAIVGGTTSLDRWRNGTLVWDEGHHAAAPSYLELVKRIDARYNFFLSAVPFRSGDDQTVLDAITGGTLTDGAFSAKYLIDHGYACPVEVRIEPSPVDRVLVEQPFSRIYHECVVMNADRNQKIATIACESVLAGESVLILVDRIQHGKLLEKRIADSFASARGSGNSASGSVVVTHGTAGSTHARVAVTHGTDNPTPRPVAVTHGTANAAPGPVSSVREPVAFAHGSVPKRRLAVMTERFAAGDVGCLIATSGLFNEGISIHGITVLIQAGGMKSRGRVLQAVGRGMRQAPGKTGVTYVDFFDDDPIGVLRDHSRQRLAVLKNEGFRVPLVMGAAVRPTAFTIDSPVLPARSDLLSMLPGYHRDDALPLSAKAVRGGSSGEDSNPATGIDSLQSNPSEILAPPARSGDRCSLRFVASPDQEVLPDGHQDGTTSLFHGRGTRVGNINHEQTCITNPDAGDDGRWNHDSSSSAGDIGSIDPINAIAPTWTHIPGTRRFVLIAPDGSLVAKGECIREKLVPSKFCKKCRQPICREGGRTTWSVTDPD